VSRRGPLVVTCEHASNRVPAPLRVAAADRPYLESHWGWDIGAAAVARRLVEATGSVGVLAGFSRLVCDANRVWEAPGCIVEEVGGHRLTFNRDLDLVERQRRKDRCHDAFHGAVDDLVQARVQTGGDLGLLSIHSFTPELGDEVRTMEAGVLFDDHSATASRLRGALEAEGVATALNEPYTGADGELIYSAARHGGGHGLAYLELELRQDLIDTPAGADAMALRLVRALDRVRMGRPPGR